MGGLPVQSARDAWEASKMERMKCIGTTVADYEKALGEEAPECECLAKDDGILVWADGTVEADDEHEGALLSDAVGPEAWSYLSASDEPWAGYAELSERLRLLGWREEIDWK